jgi:peptidylprolyl isomerase
MKKRKNQIKFKTNKNIKEDKTFNIFYLIGFVSVFVLVFIGITALTKNNNTNNDINNTNKMDEKKIVVFETNMGNIEIELYTDLMPITAGNFKKLVKSGFYDNTKFHRVISDFMIQGGDPYSKNDSKKNLWGTGGPGYAIKDEHIKNELLSNVKGTISMANSGPNSGGSQFFINLGNNTFLDFDKQPLTSKHPVFGKVINGMEVVEKIGQVKTEFPRQLDRPIENIIIEKAYMK